MEEIERAATACFTGHRHLTDITPEALAARIRQTVTDLYRRGITSYYAGGAVGFDMIASATVLNLKKELPDLHLHLAIPCRDHSAHWNYADRALLERIASRADSVTVVSDRAYFPGCMKIRNCYMADRSSVCVAYLCNRGSGTGQTVAYAESRGLEIILLN